MFALGGDSYICGPPSTLIAVLVAVLVVNVAMIAAFVIFYRQKRKYWSKRVGVTSTGPVGAPVAQPPPLPSRCVVV